MAWSVRSRGRADEGRRAGSSSPSCAENFAVSVSEGAASCATRSLSNSASDARPAKNQASLGPRDRCCSQPARGPVGLHHHAGPAGFVRGVSRALARFSLPHERSPYFRPYVSHHELRPRRANTIVRVVLALLLTRGDPPSGAPCCPAVQPRIPDHSTPTATRGTSRS